MWYDDKGRKHPPRERPKCKPRPKKNWEKEFEDIMFIISTDGYFSQDYRLDFKNKDLLQLIKTYFDIKEEYGGMGHTSEINLGKVKIKCKDGCIQIERIK